MARPRKQVSNGRPLRQNDLASLSTKVLRLQALNLPITEGKATLISRLKLATGTKQPRSTSNSQAGCARTKRLAPKSRPVRATLTAAPAESSTKQANLENPGDDSSSVASGCNLDEIIGEFSLDDSPDPVQAGPFTAAQLAAIQDIVRSSFDQALQSFHWSLGLDQQSGTFNTLHHRPGSACPVGLNSPLEQNLQDKILRAPTTAKVPAPTPILSAIPPRTAPSASVSTDHPDATRVPALSPMSATVADPQTIPSSPLLAVSPRPTATHTDPVTRAIAASDKVQLQARNIAPPVSTPIKVDVLSKELSGHPDSHFVANLINSLCYGTPVGYIGPRQPRVSRNLQSAAQHPDVVSSNLTKEIALGRVAAPFQSPPLPNLQCHPVGVIPKKHSNEWRTI